MGSVRLAFIIDLMGDLANPVPMGFEETKEAILSK